MKSGVRSLPACRRGRELGIGLILMVFALSIYGCGRKEAKEFKRPSEAVPVRVASVELQDMAETIEYVGDIKAEAEVIIYPKVGGKIISKVKEDGSSVKKGEAIAYIDRDEVGLKFENAPVESPLDGIIGRVYVDIGSNVNPQTPIALAVDMDNVKINFDCPEKHLPLISPGQEAVITVDAYPGAEFTGRVSKISPVVDLSTRAAPVEIIMENAGHKLKSGMFARVTLAIDSRKGVPVIIKEAVLGKDPDTYVYIIEGDKAVLRNIKLGIRQGPYYEVTAGLEKGEKIVTMGQQRLRDGAAVAPEE